MVLIHRVSIYRVRLTPHVNSIAIVSNSMNASMNRVFMLDVGDSPLVSVLIVHDF